MTRCKLVVVYLCAVLAIFVFASFAAADGGVKAGKQMIDRHLKVLEAEIAKVEALPANADKAEAKKSLEKVLEPLAIEEADLYTKLSADERYELVVYALEKQGIKENGDKKILALPFRERYAEAFTALQIPFDKRVPVKSEFAEKPNKPNKPDAKLKAESGWPKRAMCIGFLVGHRRCCQDNIGNGICGGTPSDCYGQSGICSGSCPECTWCNIPLGAGDCF